MTKTVKHKNRWDGFSGEELRAIWSTLEYFRFEGGEYTSVYNDVDEEMVRREKIR